MLALQDTPLFFPHKRDTTIGVLITLEPATSPMEIEATSAGFYHSPGYNRDYPKVQILTIEDLLAGKEVKMPEPSSPVKEAKKVTPEKPKEQELF